VFDGVTARPPDRTGGTPAPHRTARCHELSAGEEVGDRRRGQHGNAPEQQAEAPQQEPRARTGDRQLGAGSALGLGVLGPLAEVPEVVDRRERPDAAGRRSPETEQRRGGGGPLVAFRVDTGLSARLVTTSSDAEHGNGGSRSGTDTGSFPVLPPGQSGELGRRRRGPSSRVREPLARRGVSGVLKCAAGLVASALNAGARAPSPRGRRYRDRVSW
jgi:hypothetical protein